ncbi:hypothetical protein NEMBOFW57_010449 [Staphylotrichum longicolle]|uniref:Uncharacterized protein n=1 Tax=Staphylotrichum longicolle TaxID=669026 RepID=A0AAD4HX06_9PEZI|nr:hypothetical protein NEMBOFW57_010449 [Staphylotrichum longicolle]
MSSHYTPRVVVVQSSRHSSTYSAPRSHTYSSSSYVQSTLSMDSSTASGSTFDARYRDGAASGFYRDIKNVTSPRGNATVTIVQHNAPNPDKNEPKSSDYPYYGYSRK